MSDICRNFLEHKSYVKVLARPKSLGCAVIFLYIIWSFMACNHRKGDVLTSDIDSLEYTSLTTGVETLISDSGITKYKLNAAKWYVFDKPEDKWYFPEGLYVEQFDTLFNIQASIKADTAYYYRERQLWELKGNVEVLNREGQRFFGHSLFWDESLQEVYSHEYIMIERSSGQLIESDFGFKSNQSMTRYELYSSHGHFDVEDQPMVVNDSTAMANDSTSVKPTSGNSADNLDAVSSNNEDESRLNSPKKKVIRKVERKKYLAPDSLIKKK